MKKIEFFKHNIGKEEKKEVSKCLDSMFLTTGAKVKEFEENLAKYTKTKYALGTTSCTHSLELALKCLGIGPGDFVVTTPLTFAATTLAILHVGATPIWVDVDEHTGNLSIENILRKMDTLDNKTLQNVKAFLPVHLYGNTCNMYAFRQLARKYSVAVIEDAAHAVDGVGVGKYSDAACFSFYPTKSITCGEGGAVVTNDVNLYERMRVNRTHGMSVDAADRYTKRFRHWDLVSIGMKCNMSDIQASMLIPQLRKIEEYREKRWKIYWKYHGAFFDNKNIQLHSSKHWDHHGYHLFTVQVDPVRRDAILDELQNRNIGVAVNYRSLNTLTAFQFMNKPRGSFPNAERIGDSTISLPLYPKLTNKEVQYVIKTVLEVVK